MLTLQDEDEKVIAVSLEQHGAFGNFEGGGIRQIRESLESVSSG
jgi:hypothetical protein